MKDIAEIFKALSDETRLRLVTLLCLQGESCVCNLAEAMEEPENKISRHLSVLRASRMVEARREGRWMYYKLKEPTTIFESSLLECLKNSCRDLSTVKKDIERFKSAICVNE